MVYISPEKLKELKKELEKRKMVLRQKIAKRIQEAQAEGDITENAEYAEAKESQAFNEGRILELESLINNAVLVSKKRKKTDVVTIGSQVIVKDSRGKNFEFTIVGSEDSNPIEGKISNESPLGQAFLNSKKGEEIEVQTPRGKTKYKIINVK